MAAISIADVKPVGFNLLSEEESFLSDLSKEEVSQTYGGGTPLALVWGAYVYSAWQAGHDTGVGDR